MINDVGEYTDTIAGEVVIAMPESRTTSLFPGKNTIAICGNQPEIIRAALEMNVNCLILCRTELAKEFYNIPTTTCIIATPYDAYRTFRLIFQSTPIGRICRTNDLTCFHLEDRVDEVKELVLKHRESCYPILDANDKVVGILTRYHLLRPRRKRVVLVDHNETAQSVPGLEEAEIVEIIDHHRVADIQTNKNLFSSNLTTPPPAEDKVSQATVPSNHLFESKLRSVVFTHHRNHQRNRRSIHQNTENLAKKNSQRSAKISAFIYYLMVMNSSQFRRMYYLPFYRLPCTLYFEFFHQRTCMKEEHS